MTSRHGGKAFVTLRAGPYRKLWIAGTLTFLSVISQNVARGWLARELTGSNTGLGGVLLAFGLPSLVLAPIGGLCADRFNKRSVLIMSELLLVVSSMWVGLALVFHGLEYWMLLGASSIQASAFSFFMPARMAFTAELVERVHVASAVSVAQMSSEGARVVGPVAAGMLLAAGTAGEAAVFLAAAAFILMAAIVMLGLPPGQPRRSVPRSPLQDLREGIAYAARRRHLLLLMVVGLGVTLTAFPYMTFLPTLADETFGKGAGGYGIMSSFAAIGAVGAAIFGARQGSRNLWWRLVASGLAFGASIAALGLAPSYGVALVVLGVVGGSAILMAVANQSLVLLLSDLDFHGRLQSVGVLSMSAFGIAALPLGILADQIGIRETFVLMGTATMALVGAVAVGGASEEALHGSRELL